MSTTYTDVDLPAELGAVVRQRIVWEGLSAGSFEHVQAHSHFQLHCAAVMPLRAVATLIASTNWELGPASTMRTAGNMTCQSRRCGMGLRTLADRRTVTRARELVADDEAC